MREYVDGIAAEHRPLFDRIDRLIRAAHPEATVSMSYGMPTYRVDKRRLYVGAWAHGMSIYGWPQGRAESFLARHPELRTSKGTIQLRPEAAAAIPDAELGELLRTALEP